jgi:uncharacterized protein (TIGR00299 family) protein
MVLGALIDAGVPLDDVRAALGSLALEPEMVWTERVVKTGISATKFQVRGEVVPESGSGLGEVASSYLHDHDLHDHDHGPVDAHSHRAPVQSHGAVSHHEHRSLADIFDLIDRSALSASGRDRARHLFSRLGEAEAAIHGTPIEAVHLHEVGALDSVIDIVGAVFAFEALGVDEVIASPLNVGSGTVKAVHGFYPVPAPATLRLLTGVPVYAGSQVAEMVTPTGALLVSDYATSYGPMPAMIVRAVGYGAGGRDFHDSPNVLRAVIGDRHAGVLVHAVSVIECEIDDMNPQIFGALMDQVLQAGALDVFYTSVQMKKNRPGTLLTIIAPPTKRDALTDLVFRETTTIGVRYSEMARECLERSYRRVDTPLGPVLFKLATRGGALLNASPEFEDLSRIATTQGRPLKDVQALAMKAFLESA